MKGIEEQCIGKTIESFKDDAQREHYGRCIEIEFTDGTTMVGYPVGDCCAVTSIVEVAGGSFLSYRSKAVLKEISQKNLGEIKAGYEYIDVFATIMTIDTDIEDYDIIILCTCSHNGYYSGWIEWRDA